MPTTYAERIAKHAKKQARLDEVGARLKEQERKAETRMLISLGVLVRKAGLSRLVHQDGSVDTDALYGALMTLERGVGEEATVKRWRKIGREGLSALPPADSPAPDDTSSEADPRPLHVVSQSG